MEMHVVPTVHVKASAALDALEVKSGLDGSRARRRIAH
jgi:hypothetical protein